MSGQKLILLMFAGILAIAVLTFALYLATRQIDNEASGDQGLPAAATSMSLESSLELGVLALPD